VALFDGLRTRGRVAQARSDQATLRIEEAQLLDGIALQVRDATNAVRDAGEVVRAITGTVAQAERLLALAEKGYEYGVKTKLEVDDANFNLNQARVNLAQARRDYLVANLNLRYAMGTLGEEWTASYDTIKTFVRRRPRSGWFAKYWKVSRRCRNRGNRPPRTFIPRGRRRTMGVDVTILVTGGAGQGVHTAGGLLSRIAAAAGHHFHATQDYMSRIRGGRNSYSVRVRDVSVRAGRAERISCSPSIPDTSRTTCRRSPGGSRRVRRPGPWGGGPPCDRRAAQGPGGRRGKPDPGEHGGCRRRRQRAGNTRRIPWTGSWPSSSRAISSKRTGKRRVSGPGGRKARSGTYRLPERRSIPG